MIVWFEKVCDYGLDGVEVVQIYDCVMRGF